MRALSRLGLLGVWLVCGCDDGTSSLASDADVDASTSECQPEVSAEDCTHCGPYPDDTLPGGFSISYCPDGNSLSCTTCPTPDGCASACANHTCWNCAQSGDWQRPIIDCFCLPEDAGPG